MPTIVLTLRGPLQSWGDTPAALERRTGIRPTKSAIIGIVAAALGIPRGESVSRLLALEYGVRSDYVGPLLTDYHTARTWGTKQKFIRSTDNSISNRRYLEDSAFTAGLFSDNAELIGDLHNAMRNPAFPPFLGRQGAVPGVPVYPLTRTVVNASLMDTLRAEPWGAPYHVQMNNRDSNIILPVVRDARAEEVPDDSAMDIPATGVFDDREYIPRAVVVESVTLLAPSRDETHLRQQELFDRHIPSGDAMSLNMGHSARKPILPKVPRRIEPPSTTVSDHNPFSVL
jgi:CRISPR system Cascade subunit CasD